MKIAITWHILLGAILTASYLRAADHVERQVLHHAAPQYPVLAAKMSLHGVVKLKIWIAPDGSVRRVEYVGGHPLLAESALKAVKSWDYEQAPQESTQVVEVKF